MLLGLGVAWLLAGSLARPLRALAGTARRVADGDLEARAPARGVERAARGGGAFNDMTDRLAQALARSASSWPTRRTSCARPLTGLRLRLEAAALKTGDPEVKRELAAAERETERLARAPRTSC